MFESSQYNLNAPKSKWKNNFKIKFNWETVLLEKQNRLV